MSQFLERLYGRLIIHIHQGRYNMGSLLQILIITSDEVRKQRYFIYCPESEIFIASIFQFNGQLQINFHPNLSNYIWSDRICDYIDGVGKQSLVVGYQTRHFKAENFPVMKQVLDELIQLSRTSPELGDACAYLWGKNCFPQHTPYTHDYDSLFV